MRTGMFRTFSQSRKNLRSGSGVWSGRGGIEVWIILRSGWGVCGVYAKGGSGPAGGKLRSPGLLFRPGGTGTPRNQFQFCYQAISSLSSMIVVSVCDILQCMTSCSAKLHPFRVVVVARTDWTERAHGLVVVAHVWLRPDWTRLCESLDGTRVCEVLRARARAIAS